LDLGLPDSYGKDLVVAIRAVTNVLIIILSIRAAEKEKTT
jgi:DNA-binding response OmpR family regulator